MTAQDLIARYVQAVTRRLPAAQRADIGAELTDLLSESLAGRMDAEAETDRTMAAAEALLIEFGPPDRMALRYHRPAPLIDPRDVRLFVKLALTLLGALAVLALGVVLSDPSAPADPTIGPRIADEASALALQGLGGLLVIFWIIALVRRHAGVSRWSPRSLPPVRDPDVVNRPLAVFSILAWLAGFAVLVLEPGVVMAQLSGGAAPAALIAEFSYDPAFAAERAPVLWVVLGASLVLVAAGAIRGRITPLLRRIETGLTLLLGALLFQIVLAGDVFAGEAANELMKLAMALFGGWSVISAVGDMYRGWQARRGGRPADPVT